MSTTPRTDDEQAPRSRTPVPDGSTHPEDELEETIAPRPEEEIADVVRAEPDVEDHSQNPEWNSFVT